MPAQAFKNRPPSVSSRSTNKQRERDWKTKVTHRKKLQDLAISESSQRKIRFASDDEAKKAGEWAIEKYHETFKALAK